MIPFAICGGKLNISQAVSAQGHPQEARSLEIQSLEAQVLVAQALEAQYLEAQALEAKSLEIRFLELAPNYCSFRIPVSMESALNQVNSAVIRFTLNEETRRVFLEKKDFSLQKADRQKYWIEIVLKTENPDFRVCSMELSRQYLSYIRAKLTMDDAELSHSLTGSYPAFEEEFAESPEQQFSWFRSRIEEDYEPASWSFFSGPLSVASDAESVRSAAYEFSLGIAPWDKTAHSVSFGIALESHTAYSEWLSMDHSEYIKKRLDLLGLHGIRHPFTEQTYSYLYIGNAFCPLQGPSLHELEMLLQRCVSERHFIYPAPAVDGESPTELTPVLVLAPVSEGRVEEMQSYLRQVHSLADSLKIDIEIIVNDEGLGNWILCEKEKGIFPFFSVSEGVLLTKNKRDPRKKYLKGRSSGGEDCGSSLDKDCGEDWREGCSGLSGNTWFLPWYQMNTGTFCPLHALVTKGDRGKSERIMSCPGYCESIYLVYPRHLEMMGRFNSVFAADLKAFSRGEKLQQVVWEHPGKEIRIVLNI